MGASDPTGADPLYREVTGDRRMLNANDWYGLGVLFALTGQGHTAAMRRRVYCGGRAAYEQFMMGKRHALENGWPVNRALYEAP